MSSHSQRFIPTNPITPLREARKLKLTLISANDLPEYHLRLRRMKVYAEVSLNGDSTSTKKTQVDVDGGSNPRWDFEVDFTIGGETRPNDITVKLFRKRRTMGCSFIGQVKICVESLLDSGINHMDYPVVGTGNGKLYISYSFGDKVSARSN